MKDGCPFCDYAGPSEVMREYAYLLGGHNLDEPIPVFVIEPVSPVTPGHVLIVPRRHVENFVADHEAAAACMMGASDFAIDAGYEDCNVITSRGAAATQSVNHLHVHLVPRFAGDGLKLPWTPERECGARPHVIRPIPTEMEIDLPSWRGFRRR